MTVLSTVHAYLKVLKESGKDSDVARVFNSGPKQLPHSVRSPMSTAP